MDVTRFAGKLPMLAAATLLDAPAAAQDPGDIAVGDSTLDASLKGTRCGQMI